MLWAPAVGTSLNPVRLGRHTPEARMKNMTSAHLSSGSRCTTGAGWSLASVVDQGTLGRPRPRVILSGIATA